MERPEKSWSTLPLDKPRYIFQHGDLGAHNYIIDAQSLQVNALIDWEYAGFSPPGMERWPGSLDKNLYRNKSTQLAPFTSQFLSVEYLECHRGWGDKAQLKVLIDQGELSDPNYLTSEQACCTVALNKVVARRGEKQRARIFVFT